MISSPMPPTTPEDGAAGRPFLAAWASFAVGLFIVVFDGPVQPIKPVEASIPGIIAAVGFGLALRAFRFGSWWTRIVAVFAGCIHVLIVLAVGQELYQAW